MIHTELYKVFYRVALEKSITKAAKTLHISQPAVSKSIKSLEEKTGSVLFLRSKKGVTLTSEGEMLYKYVEDAFKSLSEAELLFDRIRSKESGIVRIGISNTLFRYYLLERLEGFHKNYPNIKIQIRNQSTRATFELLKKGEVDFGIVCSNSIPETLNFKHLMTLHDIFVSNEENSEEILALSQLGKKHLMLLERGNHTRDFIDDFFKENGISVKPEIEISNMDFLAQMAKIGLGTACVIKEFVLEEVEEGKLFEIPIDPAPEERQMGIVHVRKWPLTSAANQFIKYIFDNS